MAAQNPDSLAPDAADRPSHRPQRSPKATPAQPLPADTDQLDDYLDKLLSDEAPAPRKD